MSNVEIKLLREREKMVFVKATISGSPDDGTVGAPAPDEGYSREMAKELSWVAGWSYANLQTFIDKISDQSVAGRSLAGADFIELSVTNAAMFVFATAQVIRTFDKKIAIVCFRGTEVSNILNWLTDAGTKKERFNIHPDQKDGPYVHAGFFRNFKEVWGTIQAHLRRPFLLGPGISHQESLKYDSVDPTYGDGDESDLLEAIYITGHSLGGAMALLAGLALESSENKDLWRKLRGVYTYGQPMAIDDKARHGLQNRVGGRIFRHIFENDIVPHLPPLSTGGFDHIGSEYRYSPTSGWAPRRNYIIQWKDRATQVGSLLLTAPFGVADAILDQIQWVPSFVKMPWSFGDHSPIGYIEYW
jgi:hypothetical protein